MDLATGPACKPRSVWRRVTFARRSSILRPNCSDRHATYPARWWAGHPERLSGLAPGGVYLAASIATDAGGLLHHRFTLALPMNASAVTQCASLWHLPSGYPAWPLASTVPCGARTFLRESVRERTQRTPRDRPADPVE